MNLVDKLLKIDAKKTEELDTGEYQSARLAKLLGADGKVTVKIQEIKARRISEISNMQYDAQGNFDGTKAYDARLLTCVYGVTEPDLKDEKLKEHFGCRTPKDLAEKLFGAEAGELADAIMGLSEIGSGKETEEEIKN